LPVGDQPEAPEVHLELPPRWRVGDSDSDGAPSGPAALDTESGQGAGWDDHPPAGEQDPDLGDREVIFQPALNALFFVQERAPCLAVTVGAVRADPLDHLADQLVAQLLLAAGALNAELHGGRGVAPDRLSIDSDPVGDGTLALAAQPAPERFFDLDHRYLPKRHGA